jgi:hypothetical protein
MASNIDEVRYMSYELLFVLQLHRLSKCTDVGLDMVAPVVMRTPLIRGHVVEIMPGKTAFFA